MHARRACAPQRERQVKERANPLKMVDAHAGAACGGCMRGPGGMPIGGCLSFKWSRRQAAAHGYEMETPWLRTGAMMTFRAAQCQHADKHAADELRCIHSAWDAISLYTRSIDKLHISAQRLPALVGDECKEDLRTPAPGGVQRGRTCFGDVRWQP